MIYELHETDCKNYLSKSLFVVGEFGGNDYNAALFSRRSMAEVRGYVPRVITKLIHGLETIIRRGAVDVVVPGVFPIGCFPTYLTLYGTSNAADYDRDGCLRSYNDLSSYHNALLKRSLSSLRRTYPHARIMYADFYTQVIDMIRTPHNFGQYTYTTTFNLVLFKMSTFLPIASVYPCISLLDIRLEYICWNNIPVNF